MTREVIDKVGLCILTMQADHGNDGGVTLTRHSYLGFQLMLPGGVGRTIMQNINNSVSCKTFLLETRSQVSGFSFTVWRGCDEATRRRGDEATRRRYRILASSHPRILASSHPRILASSRPRILASSHPRILASSHPRILASSRPRILASSHPRVLASSRPRLLASSHPRILASSRPRILASSRPRILASSHPRILASPPHCKAVLNHVKERKYLQLSARASIKKKGGMLQGSQAEVLRGSQGYREEMSRTPMGCQGYMGDNGGKHHGSKPAFCLHSHPLRCVVRLTFI